MASTQRRAAREAEARFKPPLAEVLLTVAGRPSAGPGPGHKRLPPGEAAVPARPCLPGSMTQTITMAIRDVPDLQRRWVAAPPGATLRLFSPLAREFFPQGKGKPRAQPMTRTNPAQNIPFGHRHPAELPHPISG
jgi:hypothetical protein